MIFLGDMQSIVEIKESKGQSCDQILRALPKWFGIEEAIVNYVRDAEAMPMLASLAADGTPVAFLSLNFHNAYNAEIHVMGVLPEFHGQGLGKALVAEAEKYARREGCRYLTVKTLSSNKPDPNYDKTRHFYMSVGFVPLEEFKTLWGGHNPCLLLIKSL